jgi:hypothetical protein
MSGLSLYGGSMRGCGFADRGVVEAAGVPSVVSKVVSMPIRPPRPFNDGGSRANNKADASRL